MHKVSLLCSFMISREMGIWIRKRIGGWKSAYNKTRLLIASKTNERHRFIRSNRYRHWRRLTVDIHSCYETTTSWRSRALHESGHRRGWIMGHERTELWMETSVYIRPCRINITIGVSRMQTTLSIDVNWLSTGLHGRVSVEQARHSTYKFWRTY